MALIPKVLYHGQPATSDTDLIPAVAVSKRITVTTIIAGNTNAAPKWVTLHRVPSGQPISDVYTFGGKQKKLVGTSDTRGAGEWVYEGAFPLNTGDKLTGIQETSGAVTVMVIGLEEDI